MEENTEQAMLVFKDQAGDYYLLPQALLEVGRVPAERTAEVERLIAEQEDAQGHIWHALLTPAAVIATGGVLIYREISKGGGGGGGSAAWSYFEQAYNQAKLQ